MCTHMPTVPSAPGPVQCSTSPASPGQRRSVHLLQRVQLGGRQGGQPLAQHMLRLQLQQAGLGAHALLRGGGREKSGNRRG